MGNRFNFQKHTNSRFEEAPDAVKALIARTGSADKAVAMSAMTELAKAIEEPIRKGILAGDVIGSIFAPIVTGPDHDPQFQLDIVQPGQERDFGAYTIAGQGYLPERCVDSQFATIQCYESGNSIEWPLRLAKLARYDVVKRATRIYEAGFVKKANDDAFHTLLTAAAARNILIYDANAGAGRLTIKLLTMMDQAMARNSSSNITSLDGGKLTDVFMSREALEDMRNLSAVELTEKVRDQIWTSPQGVLETVFGIRLHSLLELGYGQEYQDYFLDSTILGGALPSGDVELLIGVDLSQGDSFVNPIRSEMEMFPEDNLHRHRKAGIYGWTEHGWGVLDNRRILLGSI